MCFLQTAIACMDVSTLGCTEGVVVCVYVCVCVCVCVCVECVGGSSRVTKTRSSQPTACTVHSTGTVYTALLQKVKRASFSCIFLLPVQPGKKKGPSVCAGPTSLWRRDQLFPRGVQACSSGSWGDIGGPESRHGGAGVE